MEKGKIHYFVLACFLANITLLSGTLTNFLDIDELKNIHYDIDIREKPVVYGRPLHTEVVYLSSKFGQRYECQIPDVSDVGKDQEEEKTAAETGISDLLKPMENMPCLQKTKDWWTYELCYGKYVQQFHMENNKKAGETITLGIFESEMDWGNKTHSHDVKRHRLNRYHSHKYVNGSPCDLTGRPREVEVRFLCAENELDTVSRIDEPESCRYVITVHTMRICHHPYLKPLSRSKPKTILCFPLLMPDQYEHYMHEEIVNKYSREAQELVDSMQEDEEEGDLLVKKEQDEPGNDDEDSDEGDDDGLELLEEHHLQPDGSDMGIITVRTDDGEEIHIDTELADVLSDVLTQVRDSLNDINEEISTTDGKSTTAPNTKMDDLTTKNFQATKNEGKEDEVDDDIDDDTAADKEDDIDEDEDDDDDPEIAELMRKDYEDLMEDLIRQAREDPDADRLLKLTDEIKATFEDLEEMERLLSKEHDEIMQTLDDLLKHAGDTDIEGEENNSPHQEGQSDEDEDEDEDDEGDDLSVINDVKGTEEVEREMGKRREKKRNLEDHLTDTLNELIGKLKEKKQPAAASSPPSTDPESVPQLLSQPDNLNSRVRVRVTRVKLDKENKAKSEQELKFYDTDHRDIEEAISDHLEKSGLDVKGMGEFELRVLSYVPEDWPDQGTEDEGFAILSEEESNYFRNMIFGLVTRADHEEYEKQERLMKNYGFQLGSTSDLDQVRGPDDLDHNEIQVLIPSVGPKGTGKTKIYDSASDPEN